MKKKEIVELVKTLLDVTEERHVSEIEFEEDGKRIRITRGSAQAPLDAAMLMPQKAVQPVQQIPVEDLTCKPGRDAPVVEDPDLFEGGVVINSPMVGIAYLAPDPEARNFVTEGQSVKKDDTLLIIEAMKVMNPIKAPKDGVVKKVLVGNESPVEFGEKLIVLEESV